MYGVRKELAGELNPLESDEMAFVRVEPYCVVRSSGATKGALNLSSNAANRTRLYKAELRAKAGAIDGLADEVEVAP
eukprot:3071083-Pyramimonas_sp.AAC.1